MAENGNKTIKLPAAFFLDTNILDTLPESLESGELSHLVSEADDCNCRVFLCDVVAREWLKHRWDNACKSAESLMKGIRHLGKYIDSIPEVPIEDDAFYASVFRKGIQRIKEARLRVLKPPLLYTRAITAGAVFEAAPFSHSNKGFKDELIVLSMLQLLNRCSYGSCVLVTSDGHFRERDLRSRFEKYDVHFRVVDKLSGAVQLIVDTFDREKQKYIEQIIASGMEHAQAHWVEISSAITERVEAEGVSAYRLYLGEKHSTLDGVLKRVISAKPMQIAYVTPGRWDETESVLTSMTISVDVELELEYEQMEFVWSDTFGRKIRTTEERQEFRPTPYVRVPKTKSVGASLEAASTYDDSKWNGFEITSVSI